MKPQTDLFGQLDTAQAPAPSKKPGVEVQQIDLISPSRNAAEDRRRLLAGFGDRVQFYTINQ